MLLPALLAFGLTGLAAPYFSASRNSIILLLSAGCIAIISPLSLLLCIFAAAVNYLLLQRARQKGFLRGGVLFNLGFLLCFHAYGIFYRRYEWAGVPALLGAAFLSIQFIDHLFVVHYLQRDAPRRFLPYLGSVLYLPKFFSGPVASLPSVQDQASYENEGQTWLGLNRILLGLFKKFVLAESLAPSAHSVFDYADVYPGLTYLAAAMLYALQLYFDFSGYSDIAIGVSAMWGITLPENFLLSFRQGSWSAFWKHWHASLTNWLWQYVFNPAYLGLTRRKLGGRFGFSLAALAAFAGMALFNGVQSGYYISAALFAIFYVSENSLRLKPAGWRTPIIFVLFSIALIYFRNPSFEAYAVITRKLFDPGAFIPHDWLAGFAAPLASGGTQHDYFNLLASLTLTLLFLALERRINKVLDVNEVNYLAWFILLMALATWGVFESGERFIYMQF
jgi:alginate O-acetyltransferase complex protein AlgI